MFSYFFILILLRHTMNVSIAIRNFWNLYLRSSMEHNLIQKATVNSKLLNWFCISCRQLMKRHYSSSTTCRPITVVAALERFTAFGASAAHIGRGYVHVSSSVSADRELLLTGYVGEIYGLYSSRVYNVTSTPHCQCSAGVWSCNMSDWSNFNRRRCDIASRSCKYFIS